MESYITEKSEEVLNERQKVDYREHRKKLIHWLSQKGKDIQLEEGLAEKTVRNYAARLDKFYRWVWRNEDGYTTRVTQGHADRYVEELATDDLRREDGETYSSTHKRKEVNALQKLFEWQKGEDVWEPPIEFTDNAGRHADLLTRDELQDLRESVLEYRSIPNYNNVTPEERDRWKAELAQRMGKQKSEITPEDWEKESTSWKFPSIFWVTLDAALRPIEVSRAKVSWLRLDKGTLHIPREESSKNRDNWKVALRDRTVEGLERWLREREARTKYDGTDTLWLNRKGNSYTSATLNSHLRNVLEITDIETENRDLTWYSIRHSVGTYMTSEGNLAETQEQLRHKSLETTMQYAHPPVEDRRDTLNRID